MACVRGRPFRERGLRRHGLVSHMPPISPSKYLVSAGWDDVPHLDEKTKAELLASTPPHLREARARGIPSLGSGAIYPIPLEEVQCKPFKIPDFWPRCYALDPGWNRTAALWCAWNPADSMGYIYSEHYRGREKAPVHATAIKARGKWIRGLIDPASRGRSQDEGRRLISQYQSEGLKLSLPDNSVEPGLDATWLALSTGLLKVFDTLKFWEGEYGIYRRDDDGKVVKRNDHLMDCMRYLVMSGRAIADVVPAEYRTAPARNIAWHPTDPGVGY